MTRVARGNAALAAVTKAISEAELQRSITDMADLYRVKWHHEVDSRKSKAGFPDLVLCGSRLEMWELKKQDGTVTPDQREWLEALMRAGTTARVVRPSDLLNGSVQKWMEGLRP